jgi:F1F0 ATPase subunit 2
MTEQILIIARAFVAGLVVGLFFFGGLWWTVKRVPGSSRPVLLIFGSLIVRVGVSLTALYFICDTDWRMYLAALLAIFIVRLIIVHRDGPMDYNIRQKAKNT